MRIKASKLLAAVLDTVPGIFSFHPRRQRRRSAPVRSRLSGHYPVLSIHRRFQLLSGHHGPDGVPQRLGRGLSRRGHQVQGPGGAAGKVGHLRLDHRGFLD